MSAVAYRISLPPTPRWTLSVYGAHGTPDKWQDYVEGAATRAAQHGRWTERRDLAIAADKAPTWFVLAEIDGVALGGMRMHQADRDGLLPLQRWLGGGAGHPTRVSPRRLDDAIAAREHEGVVQCDGLWFDEDWQDWERVLSDLLRAHLVMVQMSGARWCVGIAPLEDLQVLERLGYRGDSRFPAFSWPTPEEPARVVWGDRRALPRGLSHWSRRNASRSTLRGRGPLLRLPAATPTTV